MRLQRQSPTHRKGQALVEFSIVLIPFLLILLAIFDLGRGVYMSNGGAEAAREIARVTAVHQCAAQPCVLGTSSQTLAVIATQKGMIPGLAAPNTIDIKCRTLTDTAPTQQAPCAGGDFIRVTVTIPYETVTPFLSMVLPTHFTATARIEVP